MRQNVEILIAQNVNTFQYTSDTLMLQGLNKMGNKKH